MLAYQTDPKLLAATALRQTDIRNLFFAPAEVVSQFVEVGFPDLTEKHRPPITRCFGQGVDKEGNPWHLIRQSRRSRHQGIPLKNA